MLDGRLGTKLVLAAIWTSGLGRPTRRRPRPWRTPGNQPSAKARPGTSCDVCNEDCGEPGTLAWSSTALSDPRRWQPSRTSRGAPNLAVDGIVGPQTWAALPDGGPMPELSQGSSGPVVSSLQTGLTNGAAGAWGTTSQGIDGSFGPNTKASVQAFQTWASVTDDGIVGDQTWSASLHAMSATLESQVGLEYVIG